MRTKKTISLLLAFIMIFGLCVPSVFAESPANNDTQDTQVSYNATTTEWTWSVPGAQNFNNGLKNSENVSINPSGSSTIILNKGTKITITLQDSAGDFHLVGQANGNSKIPYEVSLTDGGTKLSEGAKVLEFVAGDSANTGESQSLYFSTTQTNINKATVTGVHTDTLTFGLDVQKGASMIPVSSINSEGTDLNATSETIEGEEKTQLLNALVNTGKVTDASEVDALIKVESDDFAGMAETTFDVTNIAQPGDTVVLLHFNETTNEWEYISTETVDENNKITADFSSYSPVAFVVVQGNGEFHIHSYAVTITKEATETETGIKTYTCSCGNSYTEIIPIRVTAATFRDGNGLTWEELKMSENGEKYGYRADLLTDEAILGNSENYEGAFFGCSDLISITIPDSVTSIGDFAFDSCSALKSVSIPNSVTSIGYSSFASCGTLTSITIPDSVTSIGEEAFMYDYNLTIYIPDRVISMGPRAFAGGASTWGVKKIVYYGTDLQMFKEAIYGWGNTIQSFAIEGQVSSGVEIFIGLEDLKSIEVSESNNTYSSENGVLFNKGKTSLIQYPKAKEDTNYVVPSGVATIGNKAFQACWNLTSITIPDSVTSIGRSAFGDSNLTNIYFTGTQEQWNAISKDISWDDMTNNYTIHCTDGDITK